MIIGSNENYNNLTISWYVLFFKKYRERFNKFLLKFKYLKGIVTYLKKLKSDT